MNTPYTDYPNLDLLLRNNGLNAPPAVMAEIRALFEELDRLRANAVVVRPGDTLIVNVGLGYGAAECLIFKQEIMERLPGVDALVVTAEQLLVYRP